MLSSYKGEQYIVSYKFFTNVYELIFCHQNVVPTISSFSDINTCNVFTPEDYKCETVDQTEIDGENGMEEERS